MGIKELVFKIGTWHSNSWSWWPLKKAKAIGILIKIKKLLEIVTKILLKKLKKIKLRIVNKIKRVKSNLMC